ncbi:UNVERIFIED_ORG: putative secreted protein with PEP-CTERM sorting signal [Zoogloea ramigera]|uniref:FxDxF family PEP-CTERM protein n=1 Tax=Duganella zoogloeoides TaxID=75659 RepID=A0ABZ0XU22_9BURK|nr:FxDxF family PEP-CTERM protein [Duganella zoogloeoides]WQH03240.1 FxDxF family PEP-CTERM protein [Duganella zoogloeoides]
MKFKMLVASLLAAASFSAAAADQSVPVFVNPTNGDQNHFNGQFTPTDGILSGGSDVITLTGLAAGWYNVVVTISSQNLSFNSVLSNLNGTKGTFDNYGKYSFGYIASTDKAPFVLSLFGTANSGATYSGDITVTAVPEPETYGMMIGGLALLGFMARRRKAKNAA